MSCVVSSVRKKASAGGQLEQPSEVKSSTRMGFEDAANAGEQNDIDNPTRANEDAINAPTLWELLITQKIP